MSKFLTYEQRLSIQRFLKENRSFGSMAKELEKDRTTIAKEINKYSIELKTGISSYPYNACKHRELCKLKRICGNSLCNVKSKTKYSICIKCNEYSTEFVEEMCTSSFKPPYVCKSCT